MSVVNQMLKELQQTEHDAKRTAFEQAEIKASPWPGALLLLFLLLIAIGIATQIEWSATLQQHATATVSSSLSKANTTEKTQSEKLESSSHAITTSANQSVPAPQPQNTQKTGDTKNTGEATQTNAKLNDEIASNQSSQPPVGRQSTSVSKSQEPLQTRINIEENAFVKTPSSSYQREQALNEALIKYQTNPKRLAQELEQLLHRFPDYKDANIELLKALQLIDATNFEEKAKSLIAEFPNESTYRLMLTNWLIKSDRVNDALHFLQADFIEDDIALLASRALCLQKLRNHPAAIRDYVLLLQKQPNNGKFRMGLGISLRAIGQTNKALSQYKLALTDARLSSRQRQFILQSIAQIEKTSQ